MSEYIPALRIRFVEVRNYALGSGDGALRNATIQLAAARELNQIVYWMGAVSDICVKQVLGASTVVFQAPATQTESATPPGGSGAGSLADALDRAAESARSLTDSLNELNAATINNARAARPTVSSMRAATEDSGTGPPTRAQRPISESEAQMQVQRVLEREGATHAKCTKRAYGTGWLTVCE